MSDKVYTSSFSGAQIDEAVDKVINNKIGGADWNAQEGEAGYIENKPFGISVFEKVGGYKPSPMKITPEQIDDYVKQDDFWYYSPNYVLAPDFSEGNTMQILGLGDGVNDYIIIYSDKEYVLSASIYNGYNIDLKYYPKTQTIYIYYAGEDELELNYEYYKYNGISIKTPFQIYKDNGGRLFTNEDAYNEYNACHGSNAEINTTLIFDEEHFNTTPIPWSDAYISMSDFYSLLNRFTEEITIDDGSSVNIWGDKYNPSHLEQGYFVFYNSDGFGIAMNPNNKTVWRTDY